VDVNDFCGILLEQRNPRAEDHEEILVGGS